MKGCYRHPEIMNREGEAGAAQNVFLDSTESNCSVASIADSSEVTSLVIKQLLFLSDAGDKCSRIACSKASLVYPPVYLATTSPSTIILFVLIYGNIVSKEKPMASRSSMNGSST